MTTTEARYKVIVELKTPQADVDRVFYFWLNEEAALHDRFLVKMLEAAVAERYGLQIFSGTKSPGKDFFDVVKGFKTSRLGGELYE